MSAEPPRTSHTFAWVAGVFAAFVLHLLSVPFVVQMWINAQMLRPPPPPPRWLVVYNAPYEWLEEKTPLKRVLHDYSEWCFGRQDRSSVPRRLLEPECQ